MDFDEYEYLENMVENPELKKKSEDKVNGGSDEKDRSRSSKKNRSDDDGGDDVDRHSKRSRSRRDSHDLEKDRSSRLEPSSRDRERGDRDRQTSSREHRNRDKEAGSGRERDRDRERVRERESERDGERKRDGSNREKRGDEPERERKREDERERPRRSRSHSERHRPERGRETKDGGEPAIKDFKDTLRDRESRNGERETRRYKEKKEDGTQPEADPERDQRTVFAYQISLKASERDVYEFFSMAGKVRDVQLIMDRNSRRSKGVGYIEFYDSMSVPMAIALSGQLLLGVPVMVKPSEAEKNLVQPTPVVTGGLGPYSGGARRLYVGNLPITINEDQLRQVFESFGTVELVQMPSEPGTGTCKGYAFVQFARLEDAKAAQNLNGQLEIAGRVIKVSAITDQAGMQEAGVNLADFDDDEGNGLSLNAQSRALLMQKLDRTGAASSITGSSVAPGLGQSTIPMLTGMVTGGLAVPSFTTPAIDTIGAPTECLLLKNMFDPSIEAEPEFDLDIKEDVQDECSKFGKLKHIYVEKHSAGFVYLRFENTEAAVAAQRALHGRWFAGKMITATFMLPHDYGAKFPDSI